MITVTEEQFINEICEKNIRQEDISLLLVETLIKNGMKISSAEEKLLGVDKNVLDTLGAVSEETALQMAEGIKTVSQSNIAVSTTGIAGPTGGTENKPVGLVYIGVAKKDGGCFAVKALFGEKNERSRIRELAADCALYLAYKELIR